MKKKALFPLILIILIGLFLCINVQAKTVKIRLGHDLPPFTAPGTAFQAFADEVNKNAAGRLKVEVYPARSLGEQTAALEMLDSGVADAYMVSLGTFRSQFPITIVDMLPGNSFPLTTEGLSARANAIFSLIEKFSVVADEFKKYQFLSHLVNPTTLMMSKDKQVRVPNDLKGLKVGGSGARLGLIKACGGAGVFNIVPKAYQKLQTGVIDVSTMHFAGMGEFKLYEVIKYVLDVPIDQSTLGLFMNKRTWNNLSTEDKKIVKAAGEHAEMVFYKIVVKRTEEGIEKFQKYGKGRTIVQATNAEKKLWEEKFRSIQLKWVADREAEGIKDAKNILDFYKGHVDKAWRR